MPLASRISSPAQAEPKSKKPKIATKKRTSGRTAAKEAANTTTSSTENDDTNNIADTKPAEAVAAEPLQATTNKLSRSKSASNGIASADAKLKPDLNDTMNDTIMTGNQTVIIHRRQKKNKHK